MITVLAKHCEKWKHPPPETGVSTTPGVSTAPEQSNENDGNMMVCQERAHLGISGLTCNCAGGHWGFPAGLEPSHAADDEKS